MMFELLYPVLDMFYPFYKKEKLNYQSELEKNKIEYKKLKRSIKEKLYITLESVKDRKTKDKVKKEFKDALRQVSKRYNESKTEAKINFMSAVASFKERKENVKLAKKSKSNLHQILYKYAKLPYDKKKNSLVVLEISPSREIRFGIKERVFNDLNAYGDKDNDRIYASEKDIIFTNIRLENGNEKIPLVIRYSGQCTAIFLEKIRDEKTMEKFSAEKEHHIMLLSERLREIKAPNKFNLKMSKPVVMGIIMIVLMIVYAGYKYSKGGF
ncbi:MAG: hypothetical protein BWY36_00866 [Candidatus Diapherotrites archaeon ADurb.Bin253]|nr:MAG: hypothetical protein BWY36_00866 [Candidatus Diapherotrites archaeon ADurb.Bin253]